MTRMRVNGVPVIEAEEDGKCDLCGTAAETRPYGPNGEEVCHPCGMKDEAATRRAFHRFLDGRPVKAPRTGVEDAES